MKRLILKTFFFLMLMCTTVYAQDYWVFIRTYDRPGTNALTDAGISKRGDIVQITPVVAGQEPTPDEQKEWAIVRVTGITQADIDTYTASFQESTPMLTSPTGYPVYRDKAFRKFKVDIDTLNYKQPGLYKTPIIWSGVKTKINQKTVLDITRYRMGWMKYAYLERLLIRLSNILVPRAWAVTTVTSKICATGSNCTDENYNTLQAWEDAKNGDLVTADTIQRAECYDDDGNITGALSVAGWTTNSTHYAEITAPVGERHNGTAASGATLTYTTTGSSQNMISVSTSNYFHISWLVIKMTISHPDGKALNLSNSTGEQWFVDHMVIGNYGAKTANDPLGVVFGYTDSTGRLSNSVVYDFLGPAAHEGSCVQMQRLLHYAYSNTLYGCGYGLTHGTGAGESPSYAKNNISYNNSIADYSGANDNGAWNSASTGNLSKDGTVVCGATFATGTNTTATANKLIDSGASFQTAEIVVGSKVKNQTDTTWSYVTSVDSQTQLTLNDDIFLATAKSYKVFKAYSNRTLTFSDTTNKNFHLVSGDTAAMDLGADLDADATIAITDDIDGNARHATTPDIGADEFIAAAARRTFTVN